MIKAIPEGYHTLTPSIIVKDARKACAAVQRDAGVVGRHRREHHFVVTDRAGEVDEPVEQLASDPVPAHVARDIHGEVGDMVVRLSRILLLSWASPSAHLKSRWPSSMMPDSSTSPLSAAARKGPCESAPYARNCLHRHRVAQLPGTFV